MSINVYVPLKIDRRSSFVNCDADKMCAPSKFPLITKLGELFTFEVISLISRASSCSLKPVNSFLFALF